MELNKTERMLLEHLLQRDQQIYQQYILPLQADYQAAYHEIEQRLELPQGSIGTSHQLNAEDWTVREMPEESG